MSEQEKVQETGPEVNLVNNDTLDLQKEQTEPHDGSVRGGESGDASKADHKAEEEGNDQSQAKEGLPAPSEQQLAKWREDFNMLADVSGHIVKSDLETYWQKQNKNPSDEEINAVVQAAEMADSDGDGKISFEEFVQVQQLAEQQPFYSADIEDELLEALTVYDTNGDGVISKDELKAILANFDDKQLDELIADADLNNDGQLSIKEVAKLMTSELVTAD